MSERKRRGFAGMDAAKQREIASKGGKAAHQKGTAHQFTSEEARVAGRKGGQAAHVKGTAHEFTPEEARIAGRKGGQAARDRSRPHHRHEPHTNDVPSGEISPALQPAANSPSAFEDTLVPRGESIEPRTEPDIARTQNH